MDVDLVRRFVEVMRAGSITAAAKRMGLSQPALSRSMRRLETELGTELFVRTTNSTQPNDQARAVLADAEELVRAARRMRDSVAASRLRSEMLRVGTCAPAPLWYLNSILIQLAPGTMLAQEMLEDREVERRLYDASLDLGITTRPVPGMDSRPLMRENIYVSAPHDHPLAGRESVSAADLAGETFILYGGIGMWMQMHERLMPDTLFIRQDDREVFLQLMATTHTLGFASDAPIPSRQLSPGPESARIARVNVPLSDPEAHATFYLSARPDDVQDRPVVRTLMEHAACGDEETERRAGAGVADARDGEEGAGGADE